MCLHRACEHADADEWATLVGDLHVDDWMDEDNTYDSAANAASTTDGYEG